MALFSLYAVGHHFFLILFVSALAQIYCYHLVCVCVCVNTGICTSRYRTPVIEIRRLNKMAAETMSAF